MLDTISRSDTIPAMDVRTPDADVGHEARIAASVMTPCST